MSSPDSDESVVQRWLNRQNQRYYSAQLVQDLFGDWTLVVCWGGSNSKRGGMHITGVESLEAGQQEIAKIGKRRVQHGYETLVSCDVEPKSFDEDHEEQRHAPQHLADPSAECLLPRAGE